MDTIDKLLEYDTFDRVDKVNIRLTARDSINQLRAKVAELDGQLGSRNLNKEAEYLTKLEQLQFENQKLREALENIAFIAFEADLRWIDRAVQEALGETK